MVKNVFDIHAKDKNTIFFINHKTESEKMYKKDVLFNKCMKKHPNIYFLLANKQITSQANNLVINHFFGSITRQITSILQICKMEEKNDIIYDYFSLKNLKHLRIRI